MKRLVAIAFGLSGAVLAGSSLVAGPGCVDDPPKPSAEEPIVIGVSLGLTRDLASFCGPLRDAIRVAEGELNAAGGLLGRTVRFDVVDDRSDEGDFIPRIANDFVNARVAAVIGPTGSGQVQKTQGVFAQNQILQIVPAATSVELTTAQPEGDRYLFRTTPADDFQGAAVILLATQTPRGLGDAGAPLGDGGVPQTCNRLALVYIDNAYGTSMAKVIADNFPKRGAGRVIAFDKKLPLAAATSYAEDVKPIIAANPECLALITYEKTAAQFIRDFKADPGYPPLQQRGFFFIGTDGLFTQGFLELSRTDPGDDTSSSSAEGVFGTNPDTQPGTVDYNAFRTIYSSYFPLKQLEDAPAFTANTFDAAVLVALAIQKAGSATNRVAIRDAVREVSAPPGRPVNPAEIGEALRELRERRDVDYKGASGNVNLAANGNVNGGFIVWQAARDPTTNRVAYRTVARYDTDSLTAQIR
jgi:ABC-type branched-subunit amino acid transport system substrate-binding protein